MASGVVFNNFPEISKQLHTSLRSLVKKTAKGIKKTAQIFAPEDTGFLMASIYTVTYDGSTYGQGKMRAPKKGTSAIYKVAHQESLPEIDPPPDEFTAYAAVAASYGEYVNYGTRFQAAQPFWEPAIDIERPVFEAELGAIAARLGGSVSGSIEADLE